MENYRLINYFDVWRNDFEDGWEVNNCCVEKENITISDTATDKEILEYLVQIGFLSTSDEEKVMIEDMGEMLEIFATQTYEPLGRLEKVAY